MFSLYFSISIHLCMFLIQQDKLLNIDRKIICLLYGNIPTGELIKGAQYLRVLSGSVFTNSSSLRIKNILRNRAFSLVVEDVIVTLSNENALFLRIFLILRLEMLVNTVRESSVSFTSHR